MEQTQRAFFCGPVVSEHQVTLKFITALSCYGSYSVVGSFSGKSKYICAFVGIRSPAPEYAVTGKGEYSVDKNMEDISNATEIARVEARRDASEKAGTAIKSYSRVGSGT